MDEKLLYKQHTPNRSFVKWISSHLLSFVFLTKFNLKKIDKLVTEGNWKYHSSNVMKLSFFSNLFLTIFLFELLHTFTYYSNKSKKTAQIASWTAHDQTHKSQSSKKTQKRLSQNTFPSEFCPRLYFLTILITEVALKYFRKFGKQID